jgi:hypothetical protein
MSTGRRPPPGTHHVVPSHGGGWDIRRGGADRASGHFETKAEAIDRGRDISRNARTELKIHNRDGRIAQSDSHGHDPRNVKG